MYTVYMRNDSTIYKSGFTSWAEANSYGRLMFGPKNYEIEPE